MTPNDSKLPAASADAAGRPDDPEVVYLANACGDWTGYGTIDLSDADRDKVPFESGPGCVLPYIVEIDGEAYVLGNLELAYNCEFWLSDRDEFPPEEAVRAYCEAARAYLLARAQPGVRVLSLDDGDPGRFTVRVAIPLAGLVDRAATAHALTQAFGAMADGPLEVPAPGAEWMAEEPAASVAMRG